MLTFECSECKTELSCKEIHAGMNVLCPNCGNVITTPIPVTEPIVEPEVATEAEAVETNPEPIAEPAVDNNSEIKLENELIPVLEPLPVPKTLSTGTRPEKNYRLILITLIVSIVSLAAMIGAFSYICFKALPDLDKKIEEKAGQTTEVSTSPDSSAATSSDSSASGKSGKSDDSTPSDKSGKGSQDSDSSNTLRKISGDSDSSSSKSRNK